MQRGGFPNHKVYRILISVQIGGEDADLSQRDRPERAAATHIRAVEKGLIFYVRPLEQGFHDGGRECVGRIGPARMPLDDDASAHNGAVCRVALFGMVGMERVGVVERDEERICRRA